jgi:group I intron endonuclease
MIVYRVTNRCNGKIYIGKTSKTAHQRFQRHVQEAFSKSRLGKRNFYFHRAIVKHGKDSFDVDVLGECETNEQASELEVACIKKYNSKNPMIGYNLTDGGEGVIGRKKTPQEIEKHRQKILGRKLSKEHKQAISDGNKGKKLSKETKEKISLMKSGSKNGNYRKPESLESRNARGRSISLAKRAGVAPKRDCNAERLSVAARERVSEKVSARVKNEMVDLYDRGSVTKQEISDMYNIPFRSVVQILRYWKGVRERLKSRPSKDQKDKVVKLRKEGRSYDEISECVNLPKNKVVNIFKVYSRNCKRA